MKRRERWFGKEFAAEAVRLVEVNGQSQIPIARDRGVVLSTPQRPTSTNPVSTRSRRRRYRWAGRNGQRLS